MRDFTLRDKMAYGEKLADFKRSGAQQLQVVFDFDRTLTVSKPDTVGDVTSWHILSQHLPPEGQIRHRKIFEQMRPLEVAGTLTQAQAAEAWAAVLDLFVEYRIDMVAVEQDFLAKASIRPGVKELFDLCALRGIPTVILSAGVKDVIDLWMQAYEIKPSVVLSTSLQLDADKRVRGWDKDSLVHVLNKKEIGHPELTRIRSQRGKVILIGDGLADADMAEGTENVIRIRIYDPRPGEQTPIAAVRHQTFQQFDVMIETDTLESVVDLVRDI